MERAVVPAALTVKEGERRLGRVGRWSRNGCTASPGCRMLDEPQRGVPAGEAAAFCGARNRVAFGGRGRSALKLSAGASWKLGRAQQTVGLPVPRPAGGMRGMCHVGWATHFQRQGRERSPGQRWGQHRAAAPVGRMRAPRALHRALRPPARERHGPVREDPEEGQWRKMTGGLEPLS